MNAWPYKQHSPSVPEAAKISEMKAMDFAVSHCYERASIVQTRNSFGRRFAMGWAIVTWNRSNASFSG